MNTHLAHRAALSSRELEILRLIAEGYTTLQIADKVFLSLHTIETHRKNLLRKLNALNTAHLVKLACFRGLLQNPERGIF
jgi:DNA-binding CsgD family transcriptional regulator